MKPIHYFLACFLFLSACGPTPQAQAALTAEAVTATARAWTPTPTTTPTLTSTPAPSPTPAGLISAENCKNVQEIRQIGAGTLNMLAYSPDGRWLAAATSGGVTLYDAVTLKPVWSAKTSANLTQIAFTKAGETLSGVDMSFKLYQWQVADGKQLLAKKPADINEAPMTYALSPDGSFALVPEYDDSIHIYLMSDASLSGRIEQFLYFGEMLYSMAISPDAKRMVSISFNGDIRFWNIPEKKLRGVLEFNKNQRPYELIFAPDGRLVVNLDTEDGEKSARVLDPSAQAWGASLAQPVSAIAVDTSMLGSFPAGIELRKFGSNTVSKTLAEQAGVLGRVASSPDGAFLAVGTSEGIHIWRLADATLAGSIAGRYANYSSLAVSADGQTIAAGNSQGIEMLDKTDGSVLKTLKPEGKPGPFSSLAIAPGGELLAAAQGKTVYVWDVESGSQLWSAETDDPFNGLAFSADGGLLAGIYSQSTTRIGETVPGVISVWVAKNGSLTQQLEGSGQLLTPGYSSLAFSADGSYLLAGQSGGSIEIWLVEDWSLSRTLSNDAFLAWNPLLAVAPDGKAFVSGGQDRQIQFWKLPEGVSVRKTKNTSASIEALAYSADGKMIASSIQNDIDLWNTNTGAHLCKLTGSGDIPTAIYFTSDLRSIISLAKEGVVRIWGLP